MPYSQKPRPTRAAVAKTRIAAVMRSRPLAARSALTTSPRTKSPDDALSAIDAAIQLERNSAYTVLKGQIVEQLGRPQEARLLYQDALQGQLQLDEKEGWELVRLSRAARQLQSSELEAAIDAQIATWREKQILVLRTGHLPDQTGLGSLDGAVQSEAA